MEIKKLIEELDNLELQDLDLITILRQLVAEENEAVASYTEKIKRIQKLGYEDVAKVLLDISTEELTHIGELEALLINNGISADKERADGMEEVNTKLGEAAERYLSVEPGNNEFDPTFSCCLVLMEGDKRVQEIGIDPRIVQDGDEKEIIEIAKDHFDNITDDIRVQWY